jgi:alkylated DNA repair protein alkB family protein 8
MITSLPRVNSLPNSYLVEENILINGFDERQWIKLLNRRVQHYGFEFVYGANNVDRTRKLGDMPDFLSSIIQSKCSFHNNEMIGIEEKLKQFTFNERNEVVEATESGAGGSDDITTFLAKYGSFDQLTINDY